MMMERGMRQELCHSYVVVFNIFTEKIIGNQLTAEECGKHGRTAWILVVRKQIENKGQCLLLTTCIAEVEHCSLVDEV